MPTPNIALQKRRRAEGGFPGAAVIQRRSCHRAHHAHGATAINEANTIFGQCLAESPGRLDETWIGARSRAAIDTDGLDLAHVNLCGIAA